MIEKVQKWGNSQGTRVPKAILSQSQIRGKYKLKDVVKKIPKNYKTKEVDWGLPIGHEEW